MFAEAMAVNYYELDLASASQRYVLQELLHIAVFEDGENCVQLQYQVLVMSECTCARKCAQSRFTA
jgi:hypothetical protein